MIRFLHTADWQIGKPYNRVAEDPKRFRLQHERINMIGRIRDVARSRDAAFVLVAGDLFDSTTVPREAVMEVLEAIGEMELPVLVIPGNHDHGAPGTVWHRDDFRRQQVARAPNLRLLLERAPVELDDAVLLPCPLLRNQDSADPTAWLRALDWSALPADKPRIVLAHGGVQGFGGHDYELDDEAQAGANNCIDLAGLPDVDVDYVALGDWHNLKQVAPKAWYPGTPEPDRFDRGADNQRGQVLMVEAGRGCAPRVASVATGRIGWHRLSFRFGGDEDLERFEREIRQLVGDRVSRDLLRLDVSGTLSLAGHRRYDQLIEDLSSRLLRLRLKGSCGQAPQADELARLTERPGDPLIARVAAQLQQRLAGGAAGNDEEQAAMLRAALCELYRLATSG